MIRSGTQFLATHGYKKNPDGPVGNELDLNEGDTVVYLMKHDDNEHGWLVEDGKGHVGYVPVAYFMIIIDETLQEEESDTTRKEGHEKSTDGTKIGGEMRQDGERRKKYSATVIDGIKRNSTIYLGDSIVRKTDSTLNKDEDIVVVCREQELSTSQKEYSGAWDVEMEGPYWFTSGRTTQTKKEQQR